MDDMDIAAAGDLVVVVVFAQVPTTSRSRETRDEKINDELRARQRCRARLSDLQWSRPSLSFFLACLVTK